MKYVSLFIVAFAVVQLAEANLKVINYKKVNAQAQKEYARPLRPRTNGINPFWN